jgi:prepilin-type N-terminal cleavage/methylation domain-containing protein
VKSTKRQFWAAGFTLIELSIAVALGSIIIASAIPELNRIQQAWTLWGSVRLVESSLQWGRMQAISANTSLAFQVSGDGRQFNWADPASSDRYESTVRHLPPRIKIIECPRQPLKFFQKGNAVPAGTFVLQGDAGIWRVVVNPAGRIRIQKG